MKITFIVVALGSFLLASRGMAQNPTASPPQIGFPGGVGGGPFGRPEPDNSTRFDLDFPGGIPEQFVARVEKALQQAKRTNAHLNVFIRDEDKDFGLPPLKMHHVTVPQLFQALSRLSSKQESVITGYNYEANGKRAQFSTYTKTFGFRAADDKPSEESIWFFFREGPPDRPVFIEAKPSVRYWNVSPYLEKFKVEDITTAIETGWKMQGISPIPNLSFHKDTKLLIGVGDDRELGTVESVLRNLQTEIGAAPRPVPAPLPARTSQ